MRFSERTGLKSNIDKLMPEEITEVLTNRLWNGIEMFYLSKLGKGNNPYTNNGLSIFDEFAMNLWDNFYRLSIGEVKHKNHYDVTKKIEKLFKCSEWYEKYDFLEFLMEGNFIYEMQGFIDKINQVLTEEGAVYSVINTKIVPIENDFEINEIEEAMEIVKSYNRFQGVNVHLSQAINTLSNRTNPDYRNSIKESISAIESTCRVLTGESTLGKALNILYLDGVIVSKQLKSGFEKIYAYTNDKESGIRHGIVENHVEPDRIDAKYFLVTSSGFINFLIEKAKSKGHFDKDNV